jgi:hypothetical protein
LQERPIEESETTALSLLPNNGHHSPRNLHTNAVTAQYAKRSPTPDLLISTNNGNKVTKVNDNAANHSDKLMTVLSSKMSDAKALRNEFECIPRKRVTAGVSTALKAMHAHRNRYRCVTIQYSC